MSTTQQDTPVPSDTAAADQARAELVTAVRRLADFIEAHPELPLPRVLTYQSSITIDGDKFLAVARRLCELGYAYNVRQRAYGAEKVELQVPFGADVTFDIDVTREDLCTPRIEDGKVIWDLPAELQQDDDWSKAA